MDVSGKDPFPEYSWDSWIPQTLEQPWGRPTTSKDGFTTSILLATGQETHKWGKHTRQGRANTHLVLSTSTVLTNRAGYRDLECLPRVMCMSEWLHWFRTRVNREEEMRICFIFMLLFRLCSCHCYNPVLGLAATPTRVKVFIPSVHLNSNIQNISFYRLEYYSKEKWKN